MRVKFGGSNPSLGNISSYLFYSSHLCTFSGMVFCKTFYTEELVLDYIIIYQMGYAVVSPVIEAVGVTIMGNDCNSDHLDQRIKTY